MFARHFAYQKLLLTYHFFSAGGPSHMATNAARSAATVSSLAAPNEVVPLAHVGRWIAWSADGIRILAVADTIGKVKRLALEAGESEPILERPSAPHSQ
jgi:hypothetical protein